MKKKLTLLSAMVLAWWFIFHSVMAHAAAFSYPIKTDLDVSVSTTAILVCPADGVGNRIKATIFNTGTNPGRVGDSNITISTQGFPVTANNSWSTVTPGAVYGISTLGTTMGCIEEF